MLATNPPISPTTPPPKFMIKLFLSPLLFDNFSHIEIDELILLFSSPDLETIVLYSMVGICFKKTFKQWILVLLST